MQSNDGHELRAVSTLEEGVHATVRLITDTALAGVSGKYFKGQREDRANAQAYDPDARRQLQTAALRMAPVPRSVTRGRGRLPRQRGRALAERWHRRHEAP